MALPTQGFNLRLVERTSANRQQLFWRLQVGSWLVMIPLFSGLALMVFGTLETSVLVGVVRQVVGFCITLGLWRIYKTWPTDNFKLTRHAWKIAACCIAATTLDVFLTEGLRQLLRIGPLPLVVENGSAVLRLSLYSGWSALYFVIRQEIASRETEMRLARAEFANRESELQLLRAQMNPHFIFNALNTIIGEAEHNPEAVIETTHAVADYLRYSLSQNSHQAPLGHELDAMSNYLRVERTNYGADRFEWRIDATEEARSALAPTALIQPLIENAIKYGLRSSPSPLQLRVSAQVDDGHLIVAVENSGQWVAAKSEFAAHNSHGIGLANLQRRLKLLFGDTANFNVSTPPGFVRISTRVPFAPAPLNTPKPPIVTKVQPV